MANDYSGNGNTGALIGSPTWTTGKINGALSFNVNGSNQAMSVKSLNLSNTKALTAAFWLNSALSGTGVIWELSANYNPPTNTGAALILNDSQTCGSSPFEIGINGDAGYNVKCYNSPASSGWHHYALVLDKSQTAANQQVNLYIDGVLQTAASQPDSKVNANTFGSNPMYLMSRAGISSFSQGTLDEARLYGRALTVSEIQALANVVVTNTLTVTKQGTGSGTVTPELGGIITDVLGAQVAFQPHSVTQNAQITIVPEPANPARDEILQKESMGSLGLGRDIVFVSTGNLVTATVVLPYNPALIPAGMSSSSVRIAYFNVLSNAWELIDNASVSGNMVQARVTHFSLYKPVALMPDATPGLKACDAYPNPAVGGQNPTIRAFLGMVNDVEVTIFDVAGKLVRSGSVSGSPTGVANGQYYYDYSWTGRIPSGSYFAVVHGKAADGTIIRAKVKFAVVR